MTEKADDEHFEEQAEEIQYRFELMNTSSERVNILQAKVIAVFVFSYVTKKIS